MCPRRHVPEDRQFSKVPPVDTAYTTLVFDGDCGICRSWVSYWERLTNGRVIYRPYQEAAAEFPTIGSQCRSRVFDQSAEDDRAVAGHCRLISALIDTRLPRIEARQNEREADGDEDGDADADR
jgi:hypothetical protein